MEIEEIRQIVELMEKHGLSLFHWEREGMSLKLKKGADMDELMPLMQSQLAAAAPSVMAAAPSSANSATTAETAPTAATNETEIASPMVGTFYRSPSPEASAYANVGDEVTEDSVVCIIEAMKVMNEIKAEARGVITKVLVEDGTPVQYGQPLYLINPA